MTENPNTPEPALALERVSFRYGVHQALRNVSFEVFPGQFTALLGPNGAGKTTLFSLITRLYVTRDGTIRIEGQNVRTAGSRALAPLGVVFQQPALDLDLTVRQNLRYFASLQGLSRHDADERMMGALQDLRMVERVDEKVRALNGGHRRRVEIARALLHEPRVLLLDEATVGLDVPTREAIVAHVHALARERGLAVLWATHLIDEIKPDDDLIVLHRGEIVARGNVDHVIKASGAPDLSKAFQKLIQADASEMA